MKANTHIMLKNSWGVALMIAGIITVVCFAVFSNKASKINEDVVPANVQVSEFNKTPGQCEELERNLGKITVSKMGHTYHYKTIFEDASFSPANHLAYHKDDVAMTIDMGDQTVKVVVLTDNLPTFGYLKAGRE